MAEAEQKTNCITTHEKERKQKEKTKKIPSSIMMVRDKAVKRGKLEVKLCENKKITNDESLQEQKIKLPEIMKERT